MADPTTSDVSDRAQVEEERWYLNDQREFLLRSIADAQAEHDAGDLTDEDFSLLVVRDRRRLAEVEAELEHLAPPPSSADPRPVLPLGPAVDVAKIPRWRLAGIVASCVLIICGVVILVDHALSPRLPGQAISGGITLTQAQLIEQQLAQASTLNNGGQFTEALTLYDKILSEDPTNPKALAQSGWLEWNAGASDDKPSLEALGRKAEEKAIRESPTFYAGHLFLGLILQYQDNNASGAVVQFNKFLAESPPAAEVQDVASKIKDAYTAADLPIPSALTTPG
jgi:tetratricopeptide (TPR) repeat protein